MAKNQNSILSLCVAEGVDGTRVGWMTIAEQVGRRDIMLEQWPTDQQRLLFTSKEPKVGEVAMLEWSETRKTASGNMDIRDMSAENPKPVEILEIQEFKGLMLENTDAVRNVLKRGFVLPEFAYQSFANQQTSIAIRIKSSVHGQNAALLFTDKSKLKSERNFNPNSWTCRIEAKPDDPNRFMGHIDVVILGQNPVTYKYPGSYRGRDFAARTPNAVDKFLPYTDAEMAPLVWKRLVIMASKSYTMSTGRKLTKAEATELCAYQLKNLQDEQTMLEILRIDDIDTAKTYAAGVLHLLQTTTAVMDKNDDILRQVCDMLYRDESLHDLITKQARDSWITDNEAEVERHQAKIQTMMDDITLQENKARSLRNTISSLETDIKRLEQEKKHKEDVVEKISTDLSGHIETYRHDLAKLIADTGCSTGSLPIIIPGERVNVQKPSPVALIQNLSSMLATPDEARGAAEYIEKMVAMGFHIGVPGEYAHLIADAISVAMDGVTATTVTRADKDCSTSELRRAIMNAPTHVILVEGVLGCDEDFKTLALARHCFGKIIVFSLDDAMNADKISKTVFNRIALLDGLIFKNAMPALTQMLDKPMPIPMVKHVLRAMPLTGHKNTDVFIEAQIERMGLK